MAGAEHGANTDTARGEQMQWEMLVRCGDRETPLVVDHTGACTVGDVADAIAKYLGTEYVRVEPGATLRCLDRPDSPLVDRSMALSEAGFRRGDLVELVAADSATSRAADGVGSPPGVSADDSSGDSSGNSSSTPRS